MSVTIVEKTSGAVLAEADRGSDSVLEYEGNLYYRPDAVKAGLLKVTERTYTCPYKGTCQWVDFDDAQGHTAKNVGWVYAQPKAGHEAIKDRFGFESGSRGTTRREG